MSSKYIPACWPDDTAARIQNMRAVGAAWQEIADSFGANIASVRYQASKLGLSRRERRLFTPDEDAIIRADYAAHVDVNVTAAKLNRSHGVIRQRIYHHHHDLVNGSRSCRGTRALKKFGVELLEHGATPAEALDAVEARMIAARASARAAAIDAKRDHYNYSLKVMLDQIANGKPRNQAIFEARMTGLSLEKIARCFGLTRERIRQICDSSAFELAVAQRVSSHEASA